MSKEKRQAAGLAARPYETDGEGRTVIHMTVRDDGDFLSPYSPTEQPLIDPSVAEFIEHRAEAAPKHARFLLRIHSDCITAEEQPLYRRGISQYYAESYAAARREAKRENRVSALLALAGVFVLFFMLILEGQISVGIWTEVLDIVAWVFLWEATDLYFLRGYERRARMARVLAFSEMAVEFSPLTPKEREI